MLKFHPRKSLLSFALIPLMITSGGISTEKAISSSNPKFGQVIAQNTLSGWVASIWQRRPKRRNGARSMSGICAIAPGLVETYIVWSDRPLFLWQSPGKSKEVQLIVREYDSQKEVWRQTVNIADQKALYSHQQTLEPGKIYQWQLSDSTNWITFQVMPASDRQKIETDLQTIEQKLQATKASQEEIALKKADYFLNYEIKHKTEDKIAHPWADALQVLYKVDKPSPSFIEKREAYVADFCTPVSANTSQR